MIRTIYSRTSSSQLQIQQVHSSYRLEYACPVWSPHTSKATVAQIESVQKLGLKQCQVTGMQIIVISCPNFKLPLCKGDDWSYLCFFQYKILNSLCYFLRVSLSINHLYLMLLGHLLVHYWSSHLLRLRRTLTHISHEQFHYGTLYLYSLHFIQFF